MDGIGATGKFPEGKIDETDEGELCVAISADHLHRIIRFEFGKSVEWLALPPESARALAKLLLQKADELDK